MIKRMIGDDEVLTIIYNRAFSNEEMDDIDNLMKQIADIKRRHYAQDSIGEIVNGAIIFVLGHISGGVSQGFFRALGSDLYNKIKKKIIEITSKKVSNTILFIFSTDTTEVTISSNPSSAKEVESVFDTINSAKNIAVENLSKNDTPEMTGIYMKYDDGWKFDYGEYRTPKRFAFFVYDKETDTWIRDKSSSREFD